VNGLVFGFALALALTFVAAACGSDPGDHKTLRVLAAASLTESFEALGSAFEKQHDDVDVVFTFAGSSALAEQVNQGAPADLFASADEESMARVAAAGNATAARVIARNRLTILVEKGNPEKIDGLAALARPGVLFVTCAPQVPCGRLAAAALQRAGVDATPASLEDNVKAVTAKVILGEADAGIVYVTDVRAAGNPAEAVAIDGADDPALQAVYLMAVTKQRASRSAAAAWLAFVLSADGRAVLTRHGFLAP
jgi:molybdate transport system substrate-binding protein